jgi:cytochrome c oxidase subunit 2
MLDRTHRFRRARAAAVVLLGTAVLAGCSQGNDQNSLEPEGPAARKILDLFTPFFWVAVVIGVAVIAGTVYVAVRFRAKPGEPGNPKQTHGNTALEVGWTIVPALILAVMAVPTVATIFDLAEKPDGDDVVRINVIGKQWFWEYEYCEPGLEECGVALPADAEDDGVALVTANELHIPAGRPVALTITAPRDGVLHSFWVPNLNGKKDAVPGRFHNLSLEADRPGTWLGQCAEYCGLSHANMRLRVIAQEPGEFESWLDAQRQELDEAQLAYVDEVLGQRWACTNCHALTETGPRIGPSLRHVGDRETFAAGIFELTVDQLTDWVYDAPSMKPMDDLSFAMPSFKENGMTRDEAREIAEFLCSTATSSTNEQRCLGSTEQ